MNLHWEDELRAVLLAAVGRSRNLHEADDEQQRALLSRVMATAAEMFEVAANVISGTDLPAKFEAGRGLTLNVDDRIVEATSIMNGLAIQVRRESGTVDLLRVDDGIVVDSRHRPIGLPEAYFARHVVQVARTARAHDGG